MDRIVLPARGVFARANALSQIFVVVTGKRRGFQCKPSSQGLIVFSGDGMPNPTRSQVRTTHNDVFLSYYEMWSEQDTPTFLSLDRCYLHVNRIRDEGHDFEEVLALHSDLDCLEITIDNCYKIGPHMHIVAGEHPFERSHIALCLSDLDQTCSDLDHLTRSLERHILMIRDEFFPYL